MPDIEVPLLGGAVGVFPDTMPEEIRNQRIQQLNMQLAAQAEPAPLTTRALVGAAPSPQDKLATLRKMYPDAQPIGDDNFAFTDPATKKFMQLNPSGLDWGDVAEHGRSIAQFVGSIPGGALGAGAGPLGAVAGGAMGAEAAGQMYDLAMRNLGTQDTRSPGEKVISAGTEIGGMMAAEGALKAAGTAVKGVFGKTMGKGGEAARARLADFNVAGVRPTAGAVTGNRMTQAAENIAAKTAGGANIMQNAARGALDDLAVAAQTAAPAGARTMSEGGEALQRGAQGFVDRFNARMATAFDSVRARMPPDTFVPAMNTAGVSQDLAGTMAGMPATAQKLTPGLFRSIADDLGVQVPKDISAVPFSTLSRLRTEVGRRLGDATLHDDITKGDLKRLYGALTDDLRAAMPDDAARAAFDKANTAYKVGITYIEGTLNKLVKEGVTPEAAYNMALAQGKTGGTRLWDIRRGMKPDEWDVFSSAVISRLGQPKGGIDAPFSVSSFIANYQNGLSPEAKAALFTGGKNKAELKTALDRLARVASSMKSVEATANPSGTAPMLAYMQLASGATLSAATTLTQGLGSGLATAAATIGAPVASSYALAKAFTSPKIINWLVTPVAPNGVAAHIGRLSAIAASDAGLYAPVRAILAEMTGVDQSTESAPPQQPPAEMEAP